MKISQEKKDKIIEQILFYLYHLFPQYPFTARIAREIARDEEFTKKLLFEIKEKNLVIAIKKNNQGTPFSRRLRWKLTNEVYDIYYLKQNTLNKI